MCIFVINFWSLRKITQTWKMDKIQWLITGLVTIVTQWMPLVEQELHTLPDHLNLTLFLSGDYVDKTLDFFVVLCWPLFVFMYFFFWTLYCLSSSNYNLWRLPFISSNFYHTFVKLTPWTMTYTHFKS